MAYTITNNDPSVGYVSWANLNIQWAGVSYSIVDGNTNNKFVWWDKSVSTTVLQTGNTLPTLTDEDLLVLVNKSGTAVLIPGSTVVEGSLIVDGSILADSLAANSVTSEKILAGAVVAEKIGALEVVAGKIAAGAVNTTEIAAGAITTDKLDANAVTADKISAGAITVSELADDAVTNSKLADDAVGSAELADDSVTNAAIANDAVDTAQLADGAVTNAEIDDAAVSYTKIDSSVTTPIIEAKGPNLVPNGYGEYGDTTYFTSGAPTFDPAATPGGAGGFVYGPMADSSRTVGLNIPVNRDKAYQFNYDIRVRDFDGAASPRYYGFTYPKDSENLGIQPYYYLHSGGVDTSTRLTEAVDPADTALKIEVPTATWYEGSTGHQRNITFHPYKSSAGTIYRDQDQFLNDDYGYSYWAGSNGPHFLENGVDDTGDPHVVTLGSGASAASLATENLDKNPNGYFNNAGTASGDRFKATSATNLNTFTSVKLMACWSPNKGDNWGSITSSGYLGGFFGNDCTLSITSIGTLQARVRNSAGVAQTINSGAQVDDAYNTVFGYGTNVPYRLWVAYKADTATGNVDFYFCDRAEWDPPGWDFDIDPEWHLINTVYNAQLDGMTWADETQLAFGACTTSTNATTGRLHALRVQGDGTTVMDVRGDEWTDGATSFTGTDGLSYTRNGTNETLTADGGWPAGTKVKNTQSGGTYAYISGSYSPGSSEWIHQTGGQGGRYGQNIIQGETTFVPGTRKVQLGWLLSYNTPNGETPTWEIANVEFKEMLTSAGIQDGSVGLNQMGNSLGSTDNLVANGSMEAKRTQPDVHGYYTPDGWLASENASGTIQTELADSPFGSHVLELPAGNRAAASRAFPVTPGETYLVRFSLKHTDGTGTHYVRLNERTDEPTGSMDYVIGHGFSGTAQRDGLQDLINAASNGGITSWTHYEYEYTPSANRFWVSFAAYNWSASTGSLYVDGVQVIRQLPTDSLIDQAITTTKILPGAITTGTLAANAVTSDKIAANTIVAGDIAANTITAAEIAGNTITASELAANTITAAEISAGTITTTEIATDTITANNLAANSVNTSELVAGSVTTNEIAANTILAGNIAATTITAAELAADSVTAAKIASFTMEAGKHIRSTNYDGTDYDTNDATAGWNIESTGGKAEFGQIRARGFLSTGGSGTQHVEVDDTSVNFFSGHTGENTHSEVVASTGGSGADEWPFLKLVTGKLGASLNQSYLYLYGESESGTYEASAKLVTNDTKLTVGNGEIAAETGRFVEHHQGAALYKSGEATTDATWDYPSFSTSHLIGGDEYGFFNDANDRFDVPTQFGDGSIFMLYGHCVWAQATDGFMRTMSLGHNANWSWISTTKAQSTFDHGTTGILARNADDGDYFRIRSYQNSGGNKSTNLRLTCFFMGKEATGDSPAAGTSGA